MSHITTKDIAETNKLIGAAATMYSQEDVNRLYMKGAEGGRHDQVGKWVHWRLCQKFGFDCARNWHDHEPKLVEESEECKFNYEIFLFKLTTKLCATDQTS